MSAAYDAVRITATVPLRKHLWDVGRFWPAWEEAGENSVRQLGQPRKCNREIVRAIAAGKSGTLTIAPVDLLAEYILADEYVPEKQSNRRDEHIVDDSFRSVTKGLLYKDAPTLSASHPAASERIEAHAERRSFLRARCADPVLDPLGLISRHVVAGGSAALAAAAAACDASSVRAPPPGGGGGESGGASGGDAAGFALCLAVGYDALSGQYTVWLPPTPRYDALADAAAATAPSPLPPHTCGAGTLVSVPATMLRAHDVRANLFRDYFKGQDVLARRTVDGLPDVEATAAGGDGTGTLSARLSQRKWSTLWHVAEVVGSDKSDLKVLLVRYASEGPGAPARPVAKCDVTLQPAMGEPTREELKSLRKAHKRQVEARAAGRQPELPAVPPGLAAIEAAVAAGRIGGRLPLQLVQPPVGEGSHRISPAADTGGGSVVARRAAGACGGGSGPASIG
eukprot:scaffold19961_cov120-Isochrysis_galbana.AAC.1